MGEVKNTDTCIKVFGGGSNKVAYYKLSVSNYTTRLPSVKILHILINSER